MTGTCEVCGKVGRLTHEGRRTSKHFRKVRNSDREVVTVVCRGSRRPPLEYSRQIARR